MKATDAYVLLGQISVREGDKDAPIREKSAIWRPKVPGHLALEALRSERAFRGAGPNRLLDFTAAHPPECECRAEEGRDSGDVRMRGACIGAVIPAEYSRELFAR